MIKLLLIALLSCCAGCALHAHKTSLYDELGGHDTIVKIVDGIIAKIKTDDRIQPLFEETNYDYFHEKLTLHLCKIADGPCEYDGLSMLDAHLSMEITEAEFNHFTQDTIDVMDELGISISAQNDLLSRLTPMRSDIIYQ